MGIITSVLLNDCEKSGAGVCVCAALTRRPAETRISTNKSVVATRRGAELERTNIEIPPGRVRIACCVRSRHTCDKPEPSNPKASCELPGAKAHPLTVRRFPER